MYGIISQKSDILSSCQIGYVTIPDLTSAGQPKKKPANLQTFSIETFGSDKIIRLNNCLQLLASFNSQQISGLVASIGGKNIKKQRCEFKEKCSNPIILCQICKVGGNSSECCGVSRTSEVPQSEELKEKVGIRVIFLPIHKFTAELFN